MQSELILIAEHQPAVLRSAKDTLEQAGYQVRTAMTVQDAIAKMVTEEPALVILDWKLPEMQGIETLKAIRSHPGFASRPILILMEKSVTNHFPQQNAKAFQEYSNAYDCYFTYPINPEELASFVRRILRACT